MYIFFASYLFNVSIILGFNFHLHYFSSDKEVNFNVSHIAQILSQLRVEHVMIDPLSASLSFFFVPIFPFFPLSFSSCVTQGGLELQQSSFLHHQPPQYYLHNTGLPQLSQLIFISIFILLTGVELLKTKCSTKKQILMLSSLK